MDGGVRLFFIVSSCPK